MVSKSVWEAIMLGDTGSLNHFLEQSGFDICCKTEGFGYSLLHYACSCNKFDIFKVLLEKGADLNALSINGEHCLHIAAASGRLEIVKCLVEEHNVNVNIQDNDGNAAIHKAAKGGHLEVMQFLLSLQKKQENEIKINLRNNRRSTALHFATHNEHEQVVKCLLQHGARADLKNHKNKIAKDYAEKGTTIYDLLEDAEWTIL